MQGIETIRLSEKQKQQLILLKKKTGIENWNVLCRWAICMSLADSTIPPKEDIPSDSNVEMTWKTFAGDRAEVYEKIIFESFMQQYKNFSSIDINFFFKLHLNRGISYLTSKYQSFLS